MAPSVADHPATHRSSDWRCGDADGWPFAELLATDFKVDRREVERWPVAGHAAVLGLGTALGTLVELDSLEGAPWWISGFAETPLARGMRVSVGFSDPSARPAEGIVMRCDAKGSRYRIAIRFDGAPV